MTITKTGQVTDRTKDPRNGRIAENMRSASRAFGQFFGEVGKMMVEVVAYTSFQPTPPKTFVDGKAADAGKENRFASMAEGIRNGEASKGQNGVYRG